MWFALVFFLSISPRLILFLLFIITDYLGQAFDHVFWPLMGFLFMPWTTLWCAYVYNSGDFTVWRILVLIICIFSDIGGSGNATSKNRGSSSGNE